MVVPMENICWTMRWDSQSILGVHSFVSPLKCSCFSRETHYSTKDFPHESVKEFYCNKTWKIHPLFKDLFLLYFSVCKCVALCIQQCDTCEQTFFEKRKKHFGSITNWPGIHVWVYFSSTSVFVNHSKTKIALSSPLEKSHSLRH